jgi:hypothetical protein
VSHTSKFGAAIALDRRLRLDAVGTQGKVWIMKTVMAHLDELEELVGAARRGRIQPEEFASQFHGGMCKYRSCWKTMCRPDFWTLILI